MNITENTVWESPARMHLKSLRINAFQILFVLVLSFATCQSSIGQQNELFPNGRPEVYFKFCRPLNVSLSDISRLISIDTRRGDTIFAYANPSEFHKFQQFNIACELLTAPSLLSKASMSNDAKGLQSWDVYPTYSTYVSMMQGFVTNYPSLCKLDTIGTSVNGHLLLFLEISNHPDAVEAKPEFMYSSSMHGDELTGYVLMLRLIDYLLSNYGNDSLVTRLVNNIHIWINPLANPDGTFLGGDNTVTGASRYLSSGIDPNRNFPDPQYGPHPDGYSWAKENIAMMNFIEKHRFVLSANLHGGDEVMNYPWDTWYKRHPDDAWLAYISKEFADSSQFYGPQPNNYAYFGPGYFRSVSSNGYSDGYDWYTISGGRQDYNTYFVNGREITIELSIPKTPAGVYLPIYWDANYRSFLHYMEESTFGIQGIITDSITGKPVRATIRIPSHDADHSEAYSDSVTGFYTRLISAGKYKLQISAPGYVTKTLDSISVVNRKLTKLNIQLKQENKLPPVLKNEAGNKIETLIIDMIPDSLVSLCLNISDPEKQSAYIDTIYSSNSNVLASFNYHDSCMVLTPAASYQGIDTMKLVLCDSDSPSLCDTFTIIANVNESNSVMRIRSACIMQAYPNPFNDFLNIKTSSNSAENRIRIFDITGRECLIDKFANPEKTINTSQLRPGLYFIQFYSGERFTGSQKLIKVE